MDVPKVPRKRDANFTAEEKDFLCNLVQQQPILESKATDANTISKKNAAWLSIANDYNNHHFNKRHLRTLKRAWLNMKFRKSWSVKCKALAGNESIYRKLKSDPLISTMERPPILKKLEETAQDTIPELENCYDSDGPKFIEIECNISETSGSFENLNFNYTEVNNSTDLNDSSVDNVASNEIEKHTPETQANHCMTKKPNNISKIKNLEAKTEIEMQILKAKLETEETKKRTALLEEERNKILLEKAKMELEIMKNSIIKKELE